MQITNFLLKIDYQNLFLIRPRICERVSNICRICFLALTSVFSYITCLRRPVSSQTVESTTPTIPITPTVSTTDTRAAAAAGAGSGSGTTATASTDADLFTDEDPASQLEYEYKARAKYIQNLYATSDSGIVVRMLGASVGGGVGMCIDRYSPEDFIPYEFNTGFSRTNNPISATLLKKGIPIRVAPFADFGFIYVPEKLYVEQAFRIDAATRYGRRRGTVEFVGDDKMKIGGVRNYAAGGHTHHELAEDLSRLDSERQAQTLRFLPHNELTIQPYKEEEKKEIIVGVLVTPEFAEEKKEELKRIYNLISLQKSNLPVLSYEYETGTLTLLPKP